MRFYLSTSVSLLLYLASPAELYAQFAHIWHVDDSAIANGDGLDWDDPLHTPFNNLQSALAAAQATLGETNLIKVAQGTYKPGTTRAATFNLIDDCTIEGGYAGVGAGDPDARDIDLYVTILSGDLAGNDGPALFQDNGDNSYHIITALLIGDTAVVDGFTIRGGNANGTSQRTGAAVILSAPSDAIDGPLFRNCTFIENHAADYGGAIDSFRVKLNLRDCNFEHNRVTGDRNNPKGGGAIFTTTQLTLARCRFLDNNVTDFGFGGAVSHFGDSSTFPLTVVNGEFIDNSAPDDHSGGAVMSLGVRDHSQFHLQS